MTYKESLNIAFRYADSEESDFDYPEMFYTLANEAQMLIATQRDRIIKSKEANVDNSLEYKLPDNFYELIEIIDSNGDGVSVTQLERGKYIFQSPGRYIISYYALPQVINENTPDGYEYEVPVNTHVAIPYYIAYRLVGTDDVTLYTALKNQWDMYMSIFNTTGRPPKVTNIKNVYGRW